MSAITKSILDSGSKAITIDVECNTSNGLPGILIVGFANKAIDESKERIRSAFSNSNLSLPRKKITINLAPADIPKDSTSYDLPIAVSIMAASNLIKETSHDRAIFIGELKLDGGVRGIRGIIGKLVAGKKKGFQTYYIPHDNLEQAKLVPDITIIPVKNLREIYLDLNGTAKLNALRSNGHVDITFDQNYSTDFQDIAGQLRAKRALEIAAAGGHNVLMNGPPGTGKSMLAKALPSILPPLTTEGILETTHIHSLASNDFDRIVTARPFRTPHHSSSDISIIGGGQYPKPGEISLAHGGVLLLDEMPEFKRSTLEALRQPLEDKTIYISRARDNIEFPADFMLVATSNPCPCGYYGSTIACSCMPSAINKYQRKLSGPIIDRIDIYVDVDEIKHSELLKDNRAESSQAIRERVSAARSRQQNRYNNPETLNASLSNRDIKKHIKLSSEAEELVNSAANKLKISARSYMKVLKVAQTIADLDGASYVELNHISEALQYRKPNIEII